MEAQALQGWSSKIMLLSFNIGVKFRIEKMMEDGLDQVHQKEQML